MFDLIRRYNRHYDWPIVMPNHIYHVHCSLSYDLSEIHPVLSMSDRMILQGYAQNENTL